MKSMFEHEKQSTQIDVKAARLNVEAAEIAELADERRRGAERMAGFSKFDDAAGIGGSREVHDRHAELAREIGADTAVIREAAHRIQRRAQDMTKTTNSIS